MTLIIMAVSFISLMLTGGIILERFSSAYHEKVLEHLGELVQKHSRSIDRFLTDRLGDIRVLARSYDQVDLAKPGFLRRKLSLLREEYGGVYVDLGLVDSNGIQLLYAGPFNLARAKYAEAEWFKKTIHSEHFISDVFTGLRGSPHFIVAVKQRWQGRDWILRATIDFEAFNSMVEKLRIGRTGFAFILNRKGAFQTKPRFEVMLTQEPYLSFLQGKADSGQVRMAETTGSGGRKSIVALAPLKGGRWVLCCQQESNDAFTDLRNTQILGLIVILICGLIIVVVAFLQSRRMTGRIALANRETEVMTEKVIETGRLASIGELAAGIAHEINNPVAIIVEEAGWMEDLLEDEDPACQKNQAEFRQSLSQIKTQGGRCKEITHKLLSFAHKTDSMVHEISLNEVLTDAVSLLKQKTRYADVRIETDLASGLPLIAARSVSILTSA